MQANRACHDGDRWIEADGRSRCIDDAHCDLGLCLDCHRGSARLAGGLHRRVIQLGVGAGFEHGVHVFDGANTSADG